jgi:tetratricopeptide (TPR) repeat protein
MKCAICILILVMGGAAEQTPKAYFRDYQELAQALQGEDCRGSIAAALAAAESPHFSVTVSRPGQLEFLAALTRCAMDHEENESGFRAAELWVARAPETRWPQVIRMYLGMQFERSAASLDALHALAETAPDAVREVELRFLGSLLRAARDADENGDQELAVHESLIRAGYVPAPPYFDDFLRMGHGRLLLERGRADAARDRLAPVVDVESIVTMRIERLFDPMREHPDFAAQGDLTAAAERDVARSRMAMEANPTLMEAVYLHASVLGVAQRDEEALALLDATLAKQAADPAAYGDAHEFANWLGDTRGQLLYRVGRFDEGRAYMRAAALMQEHSDVNVSNILNYASHLLAEGLAKDALELLPQVGQPSPYGRGVLESIRSCAAALVGDESQRSESLEYLKAHGRDNPSALARAYLCSNDLDGAAAWMISRLADRELRGDALLALQAMPASAGDALPVRKMLLERMAALRVRPDVRAAADAVGRIEILPVTIHRGY